MIGSSQYLAIVIYSVVRQSCRLVYGLRCMRRHWAVAEVNIKAVGLHEGGSGHNVI
jgi:hypothetical protein